MMKNLKNILLLFLFLSVGALSVTECEAVLIFHKPVYTGRIIDKVIPPIDDYVFEGYAAKLIPRAVGYSAALLGYFFRGNMKLAADGEGCYIANPMNEDIEGRFELYYENINDERVPVNNVDSYPWQDAVNPSEEDILNMTAAYMSVEAGGQSDPLELFAIPQEAKAPGEFMLVMKGRMGQETINAVAASKITIPLIELSLLDQACAVV